MLKIIFQLYRTGLLAALAILAAGCATAANPRSQIQPPLTMPTSPDCKFCQLLASGEVAARLPNLIADTPTAIAVVNRRPAAPGHVTVILKNHLADSHEFDDTAFAGIGSLLGKLSTALKSKYHPQRVIFLGDGKPTAHPHLHLIPESAGAKLDLGAIVADLNLAIRPDTITIEQLSAQAVELKTVLAVPASR
jgi:diadenosine tetraphosphate (Ap4A) HIT family hydrolase